jgi:hypothetical protein
MCYLELDKCSKVQKKGDAAVETTADAFETAANAAQDNYVKWNKSENQNFGLPHKMKDTKFVFTKPLSKFPPDQNKPTNDVLNLNRQRLCRQLFGNKQNSQIFSYNVKLCFTKQNDVFYQTKDK